MASAASATPSKEIARKLGLSGTQQEFRHAAKLSRPIFAFLLKADARDPRQTEFITEVQRVLFRCVEIGSIEELSHSLRGSVAAEFSRRWKHFERHPPESSSPGRRPPSPTSRSEPALELNPRRAAALRQDVSDNRRLGGPDRRQPAPGKIERRVL